MAVKYVDQMGIKYTNIVHYKTLENLPKLGFWFVNIPFGNPAEASQHILHPGGKFHTQLVNLRKVAS
jgi:hypothetical protein